MYTAICAVAASLCIAGSVRGQTLLRTHEGPATGGAFGTTTVALQDLDGDGVPEYAISDCGVDDSGKVYHAGTVDVFSGATGATLFTIQGSGSGTFGASLSDAGDVDGDGVPDLLVGDPYFTDPSQHSQEGAVRAYSGRDGGLIRAFFGPWDGCNLGGFVGGFDDVDGDGVPDFLVSARTGSAGSNPVHLFGVSGKDGSKLYEVDFELQGVCVGGFDRDGDGIRDFVVLGDAWGRIVRACSGATGATISEFDLGISEEGIAVTEAGDVDGDGQPEVLVEDLYLWSTDTLPVTDVVSLAKAQILRIDGGTAAAALPDLDGDGIREHLLTGTQGPDHDSVLRLISGRTGQPMVAYLPDVTYSYSREKTTVGDLDGDGVSDLLLPNSYFIDPVSNIPRGIVQVYSNDEFWVEADPNPAGPGVVESLTAGRIPAGNPIGIAVVAVNLIPMFQFVAINVADPDWLLNLTGTVPPGLTGISATFEGFALDRAGRLVATPGVTLDFI
jgi:hypothetical protein